MTAIDKGLFTPVGIIPKVRVTSNDTTADYLNNKVVEGSRIGKNILNASVNEQLQIVIAEVGGVWVSCNRADGNISVLSPNLYLSPTGHSTGAPMANIGEAQLLLPRDITLTSMYVYSATAPTAGQTLTCQFNIDGTPTTSLQVVLTTGVTLLGATGELSVLQDQLLCLQFTFGGGMTSANIKFVSTAYRVMIES